MSAAPDHEHRPTFTERVSASGWRMFALELLVLVVVFGWLFVTVTVAGN